jgi:hypothetical protein
MPIRGAFRWSLFAALVGGCTNDETTAIGDAARDYPTFQRANARPFATAQHQGNPNVNVWTNDLATDPYRSLSAGFATDPEFPVGSMIVKEMLDDDGAPSILTVMAKQSAGFDPDHRDWWYGRLAVDGSPTSGNFVGKVSFCIACHAGAGSGRYVFGVDAGNLTP